MVDRLEALAVAGLGVAVGAGVEARVGGGSGGVVRPGVGAIVDAAVGAAVRPGPGVRVEAAVCGAVGLGVAAVGVAVADASVVKPELWAVGEPPGPGEVVGRAAPNGSSSAPATTARTATSARPNQTRAGRARGMRGDTFEPRVKAAVTGHRGGRRHMTG